MIFALGSGVLAGAPLASGKEDCAMSKRMKCCQRDAAAQKSTKEASAANLCRALFCDHPGTTASNVRTPQFSAIVFAVAYLQTLKLLPVASNRLPQTNFRARTVSLAASPLYLQNLSFRI